MKSTLFLLSAGTMMSTTMAGVINDALNFGGEAGIGQDCGDCYRLKVLSEIPDEDEDTLTLTYEVSVKDDNSCKQLDQISIGLEDTSRYDCGSKTLADISSSVTVVLEESGNSGPTITWTQVPLDDPQQSIYEITIDLKHKVKKGHTKTFSLVVNGAVSNDFRRSYTDRSILGFKSVNNQEITCFTEISQRVFPQVCEVTRYRDPANDRKGPGDYWGCQSSPQSCPDPTTQQCVAIEGRMGSACDGGDESELSDAAGAFDAAVCARVSSTGCVTDDDCPSQETCYTLLGAVDSTGSSPREATCPGTVCGSANLQIGIA